MKLTDEQEVLCGITKGPVLCLAVPGAGKTQCAVQRIHTLIESGVPPESILMMTFSRAAASDMRKRYIDLFGEEDRVTFSTIHAFAMAILKKFQGISSESLINSSETQIFFMEVVKDLPEINDRASFIQDLQLDLGKFKNSGLKMSEFIPACCNDKKLFKKLHDDYEKYKAACCRMDFDDLLIAAYNEMCTNPECLEFLQTTYRHVMVDEYQDTSAIQAKIVYLLCDRIRTDSESFSDDPTKSRSMCLVGDDDQSIYGFRGADFRIIRSVGLEFPKLQYTYLSYNFRSGTSIVEASSRLISNNTGRFDKDITATRSSEGKMKGLIFETKTEEVLGVRSRIQKLIERGIPAWEIAILYRTNSQSALFAKDLIENAKIDVYATEHVESIYENFMFLDLMSYHRIAEGKGSAYDVAHTINRPQRYLSDIRFFEKGYDTTHILDVIESLEASDKEKKRMKQKAGEYFILVSQIARKSPLETIDILWKNGYEEYVMEYAAWRYEPSKDYIVMWMSYRKDAERYPSWDEFESHAKAYNLMLREKTRVSSGVRMSSMHQSKGLEFRHVFIVDAVEGFCPYRKSVTAEDYEEERRLFYVACTRAKDELTVCAYESMGKISAFPSPYFEELGIKVTKAELNK